MSADGTDNSDGKLGLNLSKNEFETALSLACDFVILLSEEGVVKGVRTNPTMRAHGLNVGQWIGRKFLSTLTNECVGKFESRVVRGKRPIIELVELNHTDEQGREYPVRYGCSLMSDGGLLMMGRDLSSVAEIQQDLTNMHIELERERQNQRQFETKYRLLMQFGLDPLMLIDADSGRIVDASATMLETLKEPREAVVGKKLQQIFDVAGDADEDSPLGLLLAGDLSSPVQLRRRHGTQTHGLTASVHRVVSDRILLCRSVTSQSLNGSSRNLAETMAAFYTYSSDSIAVTREDGVIISANDSFLNLANVPDQTKLVDHSIENFLARGTVDLRIILKTLAANQHLKRYQTSLRDEFGAETRVEVSATRIEIDEQRYIVFTLRDIRGPISPPRSTEYLTDDAAQNIVELIGGVDLKDIVADTIEVVERMCIDIALEMTNNNRVAASNMLGLSRQSLYVKIRKYGL